MRSIPIAGPSITQREIDYVADAAANGWYENTVDYYDRFEKAFARHVGRRHAVSLPSCTSGLHLALRGLGVGPGDEVIVPDVTWIASSAPIDYVGATPIFCDVEARSWCLGAETVETMIGPRTKAIIAVDLYGCMPGMGALIETAKKNGVAVIEDAAEALGSSFEERPAGSFGEVSVFSFHGSKTLTTGEGGMLVCDDDDIYERVLFLRDHGRPPGDTKFLNTEVAYKYKMSVLQAALGLAQLERIDELVGKKRDIFAWYETGLADINAIALNPSGPGVINSYWMTTAIWPRELDVDKFTLMEGLAELGILTRPFFSPLSSLPAYSSEPDAKRARKANTVAYDIASRGLNLPSALCLERDDVEYVCKALKNILK